MSTHQIIISHYKKYLQICVLLLLIAVSVASAQTRNEDVLKRLRRKNIVSVHATQLLVGEAQLSYQRSLNRFCSIGLLVAYKPDFFNFTTDAIKNDSEENFKESKKLYLYTTKGYQCLSAGIFAKIFFNRNGRKIDTYLSPQAFYRYYSGEIPAKYNVNFSLGDNLFVTETIPSVATVYGFKLLLGHQFKPMELNLDRSIIIDLFYGVGIRWKTIEDTFPDYTLQNDNSVTVTERKEITTMMTFSPQLGLRVGFGWGYQKYRN